MKKNYQKPSMKVIKIQHQGIICTSGTVTNVESGDTGIGFGGGGSGPSRARSFGGWDDWDEE